MWSLWRLHKKTRGFSLMEVVVGVGVLSIMALAIYQGYQRVFVSTDLLKTRSIATNLANERVEIVRNLSYEDIGTIGGIPAGVLQQSETLTREGIEFDVTTTVRNIDREFDGTIGGVPDDLSPADNKLVEIEIACETCREFENVILSTHIAPESLESLSSNGALRVTVFDASGIELPQAEINVVNNDISPNVDLTDVSGNNGILTIVDAPPSVEGYQITVTKDGYSTDQTYTANGGNPNPTKTHSTVSQGLITAVSFAIDELSDVNVDAVNYQCEGIPSFDFDLQGDKLIGTSPDVYKYTASHQTDADGDLDIDGLEWGSYTITPTDNAYDVVGISTGQPMVLTPGVNETLQFVLSTQTPATWLFSVKDSGTASIVTNATVNIQGPTVDSTRVAGEATVEQSDWSGGGGQPDFVSADRYWSDDGGVNTTSIPGTMTLAESGGFFLTNGELTSSTIDFGTGTDFAAFDWTENVPTNTDIQFQLASSSSGEPTNFVGPDGTALTYYSTPGASISNVHDGDQYLRYRVSMSTTATTITPTLSDVSFTFNGDCVPDWQVSYQGLAQSTYTVTVDAAGYDQLVTDIDLAADWQHNDLLLSVPDE
jgi:prepilin-type N-terminal cleavage/methylation domain-containing protein